MAPLRQKINSFQINYLTEQAIIVYFSLCSASFSKGINEMKSNEKIRLTETVRGAG